MSATPEREQAEARDWPAELREWAAFELPATEAFLLEAAAAVSRLVERERELTEQLDAAEVHRDEAMERERNLTRAFAASEARERELTRALESVRDVFPQGVCSRCAGFEFEVEEANRIIDKALAGGGRTDEIAWLVERGQSEGQSPTVWVDTEERSGWYGGWTTDAWKARRFESRDEAESFIESRAVPWARAVEHAFAGGVSAAGRPPELDLGGNAVARAEVGNCARCDHPRAFHYVSGASNHERCHSTLCDCRGFFTFTTETSHRTSNQEVAPVVPVTPSPMRPFPAAPEVLPEETP